MTISVWPYPEGKPVFEQAGKFVSFVSGSAGDKHSAASWCIRAADKQEFASDQVRLSAGKSTSNRAILGAAIGVLESLPPNSEVDIYTRSKYLKTAVENYETWQASGGKTADGKAKNQDILNRIATVIAERGLRVHVHYAPKGRSVYDSTIERLTEIAWQAVWDASR